MTSFRRGWNKMAGRYKWASIQTGIVQSPILVIVPPNGSQSEHRPSGGTRWLTRNRVNRLDGERHKRDCKLEGS